MLTLKYIKGQKLSYYISPLDGDKVNEMRKKTVFIPGLADVK